MVAVLADVTARGQLERRLRYQARHDNLTHLPNRDMFLDEAERALRAAERTGTRTGVLMIDLDRFKDVNDNLGHAAGVVVYQPGRDQQTPTRFGILGEMRQALDNRELVVYYQPQVDIPTGRPTGAEALVRWQHPTRGLLGPGEFLPVIESTGLIARLTDYVLDAALEQVAAWAANGVTLPVSVNLSARCLHDHTLPGRVVDALHRHQVPSHRLRLEITETAVMNDPETALSILTELAAAGISLSLDDYGTGYSAMGYLRRLPVSELKVDQSFVTGLAVGSHDAVLVRSAIELGHHLNLTVVAEGVEDADALTQLRRLGADTAQGYYVARPMPSRDFVDWLEHQPAPEASTGSPLHDQ